MEDADYCNHLPHHNLGNKYDLFVILGASLYIIMTISTLLFIRYAAWRAKNSNINEGDGIAANSVIFPLFVNVLYSQAIVSCFVGCIVATVSLEIGEMNNLLPSLLFALAWSLQHLIAEGTAILLLQPGCGRYALKKTGYIMTIWWIFTFILYFLMFRHILYKSTIWRAILDFLLVIFYGYLWLISEKYLARRPALIYYAKYWFLGSLLFFILHLCYMFHILRSGIWCGNYFFRIFLYAIMQPILSYFVFYYDSLWWQGIDTRFSRRGISPTFPLFSAQTLAEVLDDVNIVGKVELLNYASIFIDNKSILGAGSFSKVVLGKYDGNTVAIKTIHTYDLTIDIINRIATESKILSTIKHENIVSIYGVAVLPPSICIVLELCKYGSLSDILRGCQRRGYNGEGSRYQYPLQLLFPDLLYLSIGAARGLSAIHSFSPHLCHRDIKSFNFLVDSQLKVKLADLELGNNDHLEYNHNSLTWNNLFKKKFSSFSGQQQQRTLSNSSTQSENQQLNQTRGSLSSIHSNIFGYNNNNNSNNVNNEIVVHPSVLNLQAMWLAPEVLKTGEFSQPSDVYGLGMVLWEIKTRRFPFDEQCGNNQNEIRKCILNGIRPIMNPSDWSEQSNVYIKCFEKFDEIITSTWYNDPNKRPSAKIIAYKLEQLLKSCGPETLMSATSFTQPQPQLSLQLQNQNQNQFITSPIINRQDRSQSFREVENESILSSEENILRRKASPVSPGSYFSVNFSPTPLIPPPYPIPSWQCFDFHGGPWIVISTDDYQVIHQTNLWNSLIGTNNDHNNSIITNNSNNSNTTTTTNNNNNNNSNKEESLSGPFMPSLPGRATIYDKKVALIKTIFQNRFYIPSIDLQSPNTNNINNLNNDNDNDDIEDDDPLITALFNSKLINFLDTCDTKEYSHLVICSKDKRYLRSKRHIHTDYLYALHGHLLSSSTSSLSTNDSSTTYIGILLSQIESKSKSNTSSITSSSPVHTPYGSFSLKSRNSSFASVSPPNYRFHANSMNGGNDNNNKDNNNNNNNNNTTAEKRVSGGSVGMRKLSVESSATTIRENTFSGRFFNK